MDVMIHEKRYSRNSAGIVWNQVNTVYIQIIRNTQDPRIMMIVGMIVFPRPREAAIVQSMKEDTQYENAMILIRCMPASITAGSVANIDKN